MVTAKPYARVLLAAGGLVALALALFVQGMRPGAVGDVPTAYLVQGAMHCLHDIGRYALTTNCHAYGEPLGFPLLSDGPTIFLGAALMRVPGLGLNGAYLAAGTIVLALALGGGYGLARRLGARPLVALWAATLYLISPTVLGLVAFIGTTRGFALLPAYAYADLVLLGAWGASRRRWALVVAAYGVVRVLALFMDGYSFVASGVVSVCLWAAWATASHRDASRQLRLGALAAIAAANLVAYALYSAYVPGDYAPNPIGIFRSMGLDLVTLVEPSSALWSWHVLGLHVDHSRLWGDGTNANFNYVGIVCVALAVAALALRHAGRYGVALAAAGSIAFALSLGPSLKVDDQRPALRQGIPSYQSYLMPASQADLSLPWGGIFPALPGLKAMRASYRWFGVTRLALIMLAALAIDQLARRRRWRVVAVIAAVVATAELLPAIVDLNRRFESNRSQMRQVEAQVVPELRAVTHPRDHAFFLNYDGAHNDYIVNYLAPAARLHAYNAGGDKDVTFAAAHWPPQVGALTPAGVGPDAVVAALQSGVVSVVIAPFFHLRLNTYAWPPTAEEQAAARRAFAAILRDRRLKVDQRRWLAGIRLRSG